MTRTWEWDTPARHAKPARPARPARQARTPLLVEGALILLAFGVVALVARYALLAAADDTLVSLFGLALVLLYPATSLLLPKWGHR